MRNRTAWSLVAALAVGALLAGCVGLGGDGAATDGEPANATARPDPSAGRNATGNASADAGDGAAGNATANTTSEGGFSGTHVFPGNYATGGDHSRTLEEGPHEALAPELVRLESPVDGAPVALEVHRPDVPDGTPVPVVVQTSPYYENDVPEPAADDTYASEGLYSRALVDELVPHGYAVALLSLRGTADSGGCWDTLGPKGTRDIDHAVTWLAERSWSAGNVGVTGIWSQDGAAAWQAAASGNPHVETVVPASSWPDHYGLLFRNGTRSAAAGLFASTPVAANAAFTEPPGSPADAETLRARGRCPEAAANAASLLHGAIVGGTNPTGFWEQRDLRDDILADYDGSVFLVHGLQDSLVRPHNAYPFAHRLEEAGIPVKHLLGQWGHVPPDGGAVDAPGDSARWDFMETLLHWLDYWVRGDRSRDLGPRVQVEDTAGDWRSGASWPPERARATTLHLHPDGGLARSQASATGSALVTFDPTRAAVTRGTPCRDCVTFATDPLDEPLRFAGLPAAHLKVTPTGPGGYLTVDFLAAGPDGQVDHLTGAQMDLRFADGDRQPQPVAPGEPLVARMALQPQDAVVPAGESLVLRVNQGAAGDNAAYAQIPEAPAPVRLELGDGQSHLTLRTFEVPGDAFFQPPGTT